VNTIEIASGVDVAVRQWQTAEQARGADVQLSPRALDLVVRMIENIKDDPSPRWQEFNVDSIQREAVAMVPTLLRGIPLRRLRNGKASLVTSWEILHAASSILDRFCPIPKDL
jgi:hypothetical protein